MEAGFKAIMGKELESTFNSKHMGFNNLVLEEYIKKPAGHEV